MNHGWAYLFYTIAIHALALLGLLYLKERVHADPRHVAAICGAPAKLEK